MPFQNPHHKCDHWRPRCYPCPCDPQKDQPVQPTRLQGTPIHSVVYLVDEHNSADPNFKPVRNANTITRRYAWHYQNANLDTMNLGEIPDTINLHESIANPKVNPSFKWEGYMFDIPGGAGVCRVGVVAEADKVSDERLTGPGGKAAQQVDRVVGFAGSYMDNTIPIGLIVQVRRDDRYRCLARSTQKGFSYFCAYYISKDTPKGPSGFTGGFPLAQDDAGSLDQPPSTDQPATNGDSDDDSKLNYDQMMDKNIEDNVQFAPGATWEGNTFSFDATQLDAGNDQDDPLSFAFSGSALDDLKHSEDDFTADANAA